MLVAAAMMAEGTGSFKNQDGLTIFTRNWVVDSQSEWLEHSTSHSTYTEQPPASPDWSDTLDTFKCSTLLWRPNYNLKRET